MTSLLNFVLWMVVGSATFFAVLRTTDSTWTAVLVQAAVLAALLWLEEVIRDEVGRR